MFAWAVAIGAVAGAIAAVAGFGIGSLLTPLLALETGTKLAVAAVSIPHLLGTALRFWRLRENVDHRVLWRFGLTSATGGLLGAWLHTRTSNPVLNPVFAGLLVFAGIMGLSGLAERLRFKGAGAWIAGALSGVFGGLVGNQGGIRSAAMLGLNVPRDAFVATATAIALMVDGARVPVYLLTEGHRLRPMWPLIGAATVGVLVGTIGGERILKRIPEKLFRRIVAALVLALGIWMFLSNGR
ncbi:sulfite exporter TauE/SafE family protein [Methylocaldum sp.]|uniref:sulfite exporter TauE/SafE family protein n=1 Tax=Methylocaldum sp. TaxID=1969727 RepID=UPI002D61099F|nr:sulfite exporter TauE/SafE family protein [Methylocaldum sp.]HYE34370.1 sulfite exporter TauE/SafE family protein [Methylocaldum sp.]